ncbi:MAG: metallophosphoesterase [Lewinellaceae bacterium]|nr:metallophosphoesterase [Lewinellaceae bacterium]MCB9289196.1 metallophosphoesterase [Lewinellaceae bacterium]
MDYIVDIAGRFFCSARWFVFFSVAALVMAACQKAPSSQPEQYIFLGHPYDWNFADRIDPRLEELDYSGFSQVWLGGDVCARTAEHPSALPYLDSIFSMDKVHWALGNHDYDYGNPQVILDYLQRPSFYTVWQNGYCLMVLNTNLFWFYPSAPPQRDCEEKAAQWAMIGAVADTIQKASHLIILHHHGLFNELKVNEEGDTLEAFNTNAMPIYGTCGPGSELTAVLYPRLVEVQNRGVQVVLIGGDLGMQAKSFEFQTPEGIWLLGSGINNSVNRDYAPEYVKDFGPDKVLLLEYERQKRELSWKFVELNGLVE